MYDLNNGRISVSFALNGTTGLALTAFTAIGSGHSWANAETSLWRATTYDTTAIAPFNTATLNPTAAHFTVVATTSELLVVRWTSVPVGTDFLTVTVSLSLVDDFLQAGISAQWVGTPTRYALDSIGVIPLKITPKNAGNDYAVVPSVSGILSKNPILNLRYSNGVPGFPATGFNGQTTNVAWYPAGRGWCMPLWGYYENTSSHGWMVWAEQWSLEMFKTTFESDATRMVWETFQPQPDNVLIGNNGRELGSGYAFCLRPFVTTQEHGWWDIGAFYRTRLEAAPPEFATAARIDRTDISDVERDYSVFLDLSYLGSATSPSGISPLLDTIRANCGAPEGTPLSIIVEENSQLARIGEAPIDTLGAELGTLYDAGETYPQLWVPGNTGPGTWSKIRWDLNVGDSSELRWWTSVDGTGVLRMSRTGYLAGGGNDRLAERSGGYYKERTYTVTNWNAGTRTATVSGGNPNSDFIGAGYVVGQLRTTVRPVSGAARLGDALVSSLGATTVVIPASPGVYRDALNATVVPAVGDSIVVYLDYDVLGNDCWHANVNADAYFDRIKINTTLGAQIAYGMSGWYLDIWTDPQLHLLDASRTLCYRDHSTWSKIDGGYVRHPYGGGDWHKRAQRQFADELKQVARLEQEDSGRDPFFHLWVEDIDEAMHDRVDGTFHVISSGNLWRDVQGDDPTIHQYVAIPLYSVVYSGRTMGRAISNELSTAIIDPVFDFAGLRAYQGYCLAYEWPYGITYPTLSLYCDNTTPIHDFWNDSQYVENGGSVPNQVRQLRDLWVQMVTAESTWALEFLRYGRMQAPPSLDAGLTDYTTGLAQDVWGAVAPNYYSYSTLYPQATTPRVIAATWKAAGGNVCVVLANWTDTAARWAGTLDPETHGLGDLGSNDLKRVVVRRVDEAGFASSDVTFDADTGKLTLASVPAYTAVFVTFSLGASMTRAEIDQYAANFLQVDVAFTDGNWTAAEIHQYERDGEFKLFARIADKHEDFFRTTSTVSEVAGTAIINLPTNCYRVLKVERIAGAGASTTSPIPLTLMPRTTVDEQLARGSLYPLSSPPTSSTAWPIYYYQHGQKAIELYPPPSANNTNSLRVTYIYKPAGMSAGTHVPFQEVAGTGGAGKDSLEEWHDIIGLYTVEMALLHEESYAQADRIKDLRRERLTELDQYLNRMNVQSAESVHVSDAEMLS